MKFLVLILLIFSGTMVFACDVCGAGFSVLGVNGASIGNKHAIGCNASFRSTTTIHPGVFQLPDQRLNEHFYRAEIIGQYKLTQKWQLRAILPFQSTQVTGDEQFNKTGLSDATLLATYFIRQTNDSLTQKGIFWNVGLGVKTPSGTFKSSSIDQYYYYPGTGSWDMQLNHSIGLRLGKWILNNENGLILRTKNKYGTRFGSQFSELLSVYRSFGKWSLGWSNNYLWIQGDKANVAIMGRNSNGNLIQTGLNVVYRKPFHLIQLQGLVPVFQQLAEGHTTQRAMFNLQFIYYLKS